MSGSSIHKTLTTLLPAVLTTGLIFLAPLHPAAQNRHAAADSLARWTETASKLMDKGKSDLELAAGILETTAEYKMVRYYTQATRFYLWCLKNTSFDTEPDAIRAETKRLLPLLPEEQKERWARYLANRNPVLFDVLYGYWIINDPFVSTEANERLIEHWKRIAIARNKYNRADNSPYGTDDRGTVFVRLGYPDWKRSTTVLFRSVVAPSNNRIIYFGLGSEVRGRVNYWIYEQDEKGDAMFFFGEKYGTGDYGLRNGVLENFSLGNLTLQNINGTRYNDIRYRRYARGMARLGIFEHLTPYHEYFESIYNYFSHNLEVGSTARSTIRASFSRLPASSNFSASSNRDLYRQSMSGIRGIDRHRAKRRRQLAPSAESGLIREENRLSTSLGTYRFLDDRGNPEFVLALRPRPSNDHLETSDTLYISNQVFAYDSSWTILAHIDDPNLINPDQGISTYLYTLGEQIIERRIFFSSELINPSRAYIRLPGRVNPATSGILSTTGKRKLTIGDPLPTDRPLTVSDIILSEKSANRLDNRIPVAPNLSRIFRTGQDINLYFEVYNIPEGGYSMTYHFKKVRKLWWDKIIKPGSDVTIVNKQARGTDRQLFSINTPDIKSDEYRLVLKITSLGQPEITREIEVPFTISESER